MSPRKLDRPLTDSEAGNKLDQEVRRVTRVLMQVRDTPGVYERLRAGTYKQTHGAMEMLLCELAEFWTDAKTVQYIRDLRRQAGIIEPPHGGSCGTPTYFNEQQKFWQRCSHPQECHDEYTGGCLATVWCECTGYRPWPVDEDVA